MILWGKYRLLLYLILIPALVFLGLQASKLKYTHDFSDFFPSGDPDLEYYKSVKDSFSKGGDYLIIGITHNDNIFERDFLWKLRYYELKLDSIQGIANVSCLSSLSYFITYPDSNHQIAFIDIQDSAKITEDTNRLFSYVDVHPKFVSPDRMSTCLYIMLDSTASDTILKTVKQKTEAEQFSNYYVFGNRVAQESYQEALKDEMIWLTILALIIISVILLLYYRSVSLLLIGLIFLATTNMVTLGIMNLLGLDFNILSVTLPSIVAIVSMSDLIHIFSRFMEEASSLSKSDRLTIAFKDIRQSLFLTSLTTGIGFASLAFTGVGPFIEFGLMCTMGIALAFILTLVWVPELIRLLQWGKRQNGLSGVGITFSGTHRVVTKNRLFIVIASALITAGGLFAGSKIKIDSYIYEDLDSDDPLSQSLTFFENNFFGIRNMNLYIDIKAPKDVYDKEVFTKLNEIEDYLYEHYDAREVYSIATLGKRCNRMFNQGDPDFFSVPMDSTFDRLTKHLKSIEESTRGILANENRLTQLKIKTDDVGSYRVKQKTQELTKFLDTTLDPELMTYHISGMPLFLDRSNEKITYYLFMSLIGALVIILLIVGILHRSLKMALIGLVPNIFPLITLFLVMYFGDISLKKSTAVVFTIAFGIAVDDTIHFLSRLHLELKRGLGMKEAIQRTYSSTGMAIVLTSVVLVGGFGTLTFSTFYSTYLTGGLISIALVSALFADMVILPALLKLVYKKKL